MGLGWFKLGFGLKIWFTLSCFLPNKLVSSERQSQGNKKKMKRAQYFISLKRGRKEAHFLVPKLCRKKTKTTWHVVEETSPRKLQPSKKTCDLWEFWFLVKYRLEMEDVFLNIFWFVFENVFLFIFKWI